MLLCVQNILPWPGCPVWHLPAASFLHPVSLCRALSSNALSFLSPAPSFPVLSGTPHDALQGARKYTAPPVQYGGVHRFVLPKLANGRPGNPVSCDQRICNFLRLLQLLPEWFVIVPFRAYIPSSAFLRVCGINFSQRFALLAHKANLFFMKFLKASCLQVKALPLP